MMRPMAIFFGLANVIKSTYYFMCKILEAIIIMIGKIVEWVIIISIKVSFFRKDIFHG